MQHGNLAYRHFNPRSPHGERRTMPLSFFPTHPFQPTLPARGATRFLSKIRQESSISTHAPRTGSDGRQVLDVVNCCPFQPTLPARGATSKRSAPSTSTQFQPTLPARGATVRLALSQWLAENFNPRSPHGERRKLSAALSQTKTFQPTLPARGATNDVVHFLRFHLEFQPTLPARGATKPPDRKR